LAKGHIDNSVTRPIYFLHKFRWSLKGAFMAPSAVPRLLADSFRLAGPPASERRRDRVQSTVDLAIRTP
jgi:hypothetical protein